MEVCRGTNDVGWDGDESIVVGDMAGLEEVADERKERGE